MSLLHHTNTSSRLVYQSSEDVLKIFERCENYNKLFPGITRSRRISGYSCYLQGENPKVWLQISVKTYRLSQNRYLVKSKMVNGYPLTFESEALIEPGKLKNQTLVHLGMKSTVFGVPQALLNSYIKSITRRALERLH